MITVGFILSFAAIAVVYADDCERLMDAAYGGDIGIAETLLIRGCNANQTRKSDEANPLIFAVQGGYAEMAELFLKNEANPNQVMHNSWTALMSAVQGGYSKIAGLLLMYGADPNRTLENGWAAIFFAAQNGHSKIAELLLMYGANPNQVSNDGRTPLMVAYGNGHDVLAQMLVQNGANLDHTDNNGITAKMYGSSKSQNRIIPKLNRFLQNYLPEDKDLIKRVGWSGEHCSGLAMFWLYSKWLDTQLEICGSRYNSFWFGETLNSISVWDGEKELTKKEIFDFENFIKTVDFLQQSNKYLPISQGDVGVSFNFSMLDTQGRNLKTEYTIVSKVTVDQLSDLLTKIIYENRLIDITLMINNQETEGIHAVGIFKNQVEYYYDPNDVRGEIKCNSMVDVAEKIFASAKCEHDERCTMAFAIKSFEESVAAYPDQVDILTGHNFIFDDVSPLYLAAYIGCLKSLEYFLDLGMDPNRMTSGGWIAVVSAAQNGYADVVKLFLKYGVDPDQRDKMGWTALMLAAENNHIKTVRLLLENNADPNQVLGDDGTTALMLAAQNGHAGVVNLLLKYGAKPNQKHKNGRAAVFFAVQNGYDDVAKLLSN